MSNVRFSQDLCFWLLLRADPLGAHLDYFRMSATLPLPDHGRVARHSV
jgi:hypothetical protein